MSGKVSTLERELIEEGNHWRGECDRLIADESQWAANCEPYKAAMHKWMDCLQKLILLKNDLGRPQ